jgi:hypothetical protein
MFVKLEIEQGISADTFYNAFKDVLGKSIMFIVRKSIHEPMFLGTTYDVIRVADSQSILNYFMEKGNCVVSSKVMLILMLLFFTYFC